MPRKATIAMARMTQRRRERRPILGGGCWSTATRSPAARAQGYRRRLSWVLFQVGDCVLVGRDRDDRHPVGDRAGVVRLALRREEDRGAGVLRSHDLLLDAPDRT